MESIGETKKLKLSRGTTDEDQPTTSGHKRCAQPLVDFLRENANAERELSWTLNERIRENSRKRYKP